MGLVTHTMHEATGGGEGCTGVQSIPPITAVITLQPPPFLPTWLARSLTPSVRGRIHWYIRIWLVVVVVVVRAGGCVGGYVDVVVA